MTGWNVFDQATLLSVLRGMHLAATLSLLGVVSFNVWVLPAAATDRPVMLPLLIRLWRISGILAVLIGVAWLVLQAAVIAGADDLSDLAAALPVVAQQTRFGQTVLLRLGLLVLATLLAGRSRFRLYSVLLLTAVALGLQGEIGHAGAMGGRIGEGLVASESLHLIAAGIWLGALVPLWFSVGRLPPRAGAAVCERFSPIGLACVLVIAGTGIAQGIELIGGLPALVGTHYGRIACVKIGLFVLALVLAALNRLRFTDRLADAVPFARSRLRVSLAIETLVGLAIILAAGFLASNSPGMHDQPVWPFPWRFSLVTVNEDADFRWEVITSVVLIGAMMLALLATCLWRRYRLLALAALAGVIALRAPSFALLTVEAYPTSFQTSPTRFAATSIVRGQVLFAQACASCHGPAGDGNQETVAGLRIRPADLTAPHLWDHSDGELFWWLTHGIDDPEGGLAMPGFPSLSAADRWALIDYMHAHAYGVATQQDAGLELHVPVPAMPVHCDGLDAVTTDDLRGSVVFAVAGRTVQDQIPAQLGVHVVTLNLRQNAANPPKYGACIADTPEAWQAFAVLADLALDKLEGTEFLIDADGWLRAVHTPTSPGGWRTSDDMIAAVRRIAVSPVQQNSSGVHHAHTD